MQVVETKREGAVVLLTRQELAILANAINETFEAVAAWEFPTRVGAKPEEADALRNRIVEALEAVKAI